ncbi:AAC(3) family N-acetyltransferase [Streptomyces johnsoniae]|uniref:AAC(3) family N-acetyltransferase n=1 Tax=Streptomyces johnsoniae TaxID=3075532 RepID=A0ABU2S4K8_9ACTN|nr:AAC(3) family N-acetyltransferase [Streptomyces sp. DSM 41886]MDT0443923.1 AAC(3) family N-acetyltransferase [Streptomyces sp. DSM 41886]
MTLSVPQLAAVADELLPPGRPVMVHASLRSFGEPVEGGPDGVLDALLGRGRTVLVPAFTESFFLAAAPAHLRPGRNGTDYATPPDESARPPGHAFRVDCGLVDPAMGALPAAVLARADGHRGLHPLDSFAAVGPLAAGLAAAQSPSDVYGPVRALAAAGGTVLLLGVGLSRMTALHLAEQRSGRRLFVRWARRPGGEVFMVEAGSCSEGFPRFEPYLRHCAATRMVRASRWTAYPAARALAAAVAALRADQTLTRCADPSCAACRDSIAGGPVGPAPLG